MPESGSDTKFEEVMLPSTLATCQTWENRPPRQQNRAGPDGEAQVSSARVRVVSSSYLLQHSGEQEQHLDWVAQ